MWSLIKFYVIIFKTFFGLGRFSNQNARLVTALSVRRVWSR